MHWKGLEQPTKSSKIRTNDIQRRCSNPIASSRLGGESMQVKVGWWKPAENNLRMEITLRMPDSAGATDPRQQNTLFFSVCKKKYEGGIHKFKVALLQLFNEWTTVYIVPLLFSYRSLITDFFQWYGWPNEHNGISDSTNGGTHNGPAGYDWGQAQDNHGRKSSGRFSSLQ